MKKTKKIMAFLLSALMIFSALSSFALCFAADETLSYPITDYNPGVKCPDPVPLLCIVVNFDANGNGADDNADGKNYGKVVDKNNALYGEQWCHFNHDIWYNMLFAEEGQTLMNYYKLMSDGKFYFTPAPETYVDEKKNGVANDGIVEVVINDRHLNTHKDFVYYFQTAMQQIDEYVDFSVFDKNGNGRIDEKELVISFINGGAELAQTPYNWQNQGNYGMEAFRSRAYYRQHNATSPLLYDADGYTVGYGGIFTTGSWSYHSTRADKATEFAVWAHELGHYLGAPDYYDTDKGNAENDIGNDFVTSYYSLMGKGCHGGQPSHLDPFTMTSECTGYGFHTAQDIQEDGVYTLYSKTSSEGKYNVIKVNTPNPDEYYLIENRYVSPDYKGEAFDKYNIADKQGIVIWHVDESSYSRTGANNATSKKDPTLAVYSTTTKEIARTYGNFPVAFGGSFKVFNPTEYKFPTSKTWYTSMTDAEAKKVKDLRIEVVSGLGEEMQIKITGSYKLELVPEISVFAYDWTQTSVTIKGKLETLNYSTLTNATFTLTDKGTNEVVKQEQIKFNPDYTYEIPCDGLSAGKEYEFKVVAESSHGEAVTKNTGFTKPEEVKQATVTIVINSDQYGTLTQTVKVGNSIKIRGQFTKAGHYFGGWYLDAEYTKPYTIAPIETAENFTIYAKWIEGQDPSQTTAPPVSTTQGTIPPVNTTAPVQGGGNGGGNTAVIVIAAVAAVVLVGGGAGIAVVAKKKGKKN